MFLLWMICSSLIWWKDSSPGYCITLKTELLDSFISLIYISTLILYFCKCMVILGPLHLSCSCIFEFLVTSLMKTITTIFSLWDEFLLLIQWYKAISVTSSSVAKLVSVFQGIYFIMCHNQHKLVITLPHFFFNHL